MCPELSHGSKQRRKDYRYRVAFAVMITITHMIRSCAVKLSSHSYPLLQDRASRWILRGRINSDHIICCRTNVHFLSDPEAHTSPSCVTTSPTRKNPQRTPPLHHPSHAHWDYLRSSIHFQPWIAVLLLEEAAIGIQARTNHQRVSKPYLTSPKRNGLPVLGESMGLEQPLTRISTPHLQLLSTYTSARTFAAVILLIVSRHSLRAN